jgi:transcriptional regulator GlxA family with amidase domain
MNEPRNVAILVFDDVEVLDFCGPFEVFSITGRSGDATHFNVYTVAEHSRPVVARNGLSVNPEHALDDHPRPNVLVVPGGAGTRREMNRAPLLDWIKRVEPGCELVLSVCTGALLLARAGLLDGLRATTHHEVLDTLREVAPRTEIMTGVRYVDNGRIIVAAGIAAGIDASLHAVARLVGEETARKTASHMEYDWRPIGG